MPIFNLSIWEYIYDGDGILKKEIHKTYDTDGVFQTMDKRLILAGGGYVIEDYQTANANVVKTYSLNGQKIAQRKDGSLEYFIADHLGSISAVIDGDGDIVSQQRYLPFGEVRGDTYIDDTISETDYGYTGQENNGDIGWKNYYARWYSPALGRFTQPDTITPDLYNPQSLNRYSYVMNNPYGYTDPSGHSAESRCENLPNPSDQQACMDSLDKQLENTIGGSEIEAWKLMALTLAIFAETQNGEWDNSRQEIMAWVFLNRLTVASDSYEKMFYAIKGGQSAITVFYDPNHPKASAGLLDMAPYLDLYPNDKYKAYEAWTNDFMDQFSNGSNYEQFLNTRKIVEEAYGNWLTEGSFSSVDAAAGMTDFAIVESPAMTMRCTGTACGGNPKTQKFRAEHIEGYRYSYFSFYEKSYGKCTWFLLSNRSLYGTEIDALAGQ